MKRNIEREREGDIVFGCASCKTFLKIPRKNGQRHIPARNVIFRLTPFSRSGDILLAVISVTSKKSPNVYKSCPKMISLEK